MEDVRNRTLTCDLCEKPATILIDGRCCDCNPFMACKKCRKGTYKSNPLPSWMNRFVCDTCGHKVSK